MAYKYYRRPLNNQKIDKKEQPFFSKTMDRSPQAESKGHAFFQKKGLSIGQPGDKYEQEADAMADAVVNHASPNSQLQKKEINSIQRQTLFSHEQETSVQKQGEEEEPVQAKQEEEEMVQSKNEEEEMMQAKVEEEEPVQAKEEEEEAIQAKAVEEEEAVQAQKDKEEEPVQAQKEEEEPIQAKESGKQLGIVSKDLKQNLEDSKGQGQMLPKKSRKEMEHAFGADFKGVTVHTDSRAIQMNKSLGAQAFTHGEDIYFNSGKYNPDVSNGKRLLAHELTHVVQQNGLKSSTKKVNGQTHSKKSVFQQTGGDTVSKQGLLNPAQEANAINFNNSRYDGRSRRIIQDITGVAVDGAIGSQTVEAIAAFQSANALSVDGKVGQNTLNTMVNNRTLANRHDHAIQLTTDFNNMDLSNTLSVSFDPGIGFTGMASTSFEPGGLKVIRLGILSFLSPGILKTVIEQQLALPVPAVPAVGPLPNHLNGVEELAAINFNNAKFTDLRSRMAIQGITGSVIDGIIGRNCVERIAEFQNSNGLSVDGKVGEQTLRVMVSQLDANNQENTAIRLIMDFYNMQTHGALLDIRFDPNLTTANASTGGILPGPSTVRIGPPAFAQGFEGLVHTIVHELEHVRQRKVGILNQDIREFLSEAIEILSVGMPEEDVAGFFDDARRALNRWNNIPAVDRRARWARFEEVRNKVRQRFNAATLAEQATHQATLNAYNVVVRP